MDESDPEYLQCIEDQARNGDEIEDFLDVVVDTGAQETKCELNIQDNIWN